MTTTAAWRECTRAHPCPGCGKHDWCARADDGAFVCMRGANAPAGFRLLSTRLDGGRIFAPDDAPRRNGHAAKSNGTASNPRPFPSREAAIEAARRTVAKRAEIAIDDVSLGGEWTYHRADGGEAFQVVRLNFADDKECRPLHQSAEGWLLGYPPGPRVLYRLPQLLTADTAANVYFVEGEKCDDALAATGAIVTTSPGGCKGTGQADVTPMQGRRVVILPDHDKPGAAYALDVARLCHKAGATSIRIIRLSEVWPDMPEGGDIADMLDDGGPWECKDDADVIAALEALAEAAPEWAADRASNIEPVGKDDAPDPIDRVVAVRMSDVQRERIRWTWPNRVPEGKLSLMAGDGDLGKSTVVFDMMARISTGRPWPDGAPCARGSCILCTAEDGLGDTVGPRLDAAGADSARIFALQAIRDKADDGAPIERTLDIYRDLRFMEALLDQVGDCKMIVLDPLSAYFPAVGRGRLDSHVDAQIRAVLTPLAEMANRRAVAVVGILHLGKDRSGGRKAVHRVLGGVGFTAAARAVWAFTEHPDEPERLRVMARAKLNLADRKDSTALQYEIVGAPEHGATRVVWHGVAEGIDLDAALGPKGEPSTVDDAVDWLRARLAAGPVDAKVLTTEAKSAEGFFEATLHRASRRLKVVKVKVGFDDGKWEWKLPGAGGGV